MGLWDDWKNDLIIIGCTGIVVFATVLIPKFLREKGIISQLFARKIIHSFSGLAVFITPYLDHPIVAGFLALLMTIITRTSGKKSQIKVQRDLYHAINEDEEKEVGYLQGPFAYCLAITILVFVFIPMADKYYYPIAAILIMMFADTFAGIIGRKYGKHHINIPWVGSKRTVEGSIAFIVVAILCSLFTFFFFGQLLPGNSMVLSTGQALLLTFILSIGSAVLELMSPSKFDDLIVPLGSTLLISLIAYALQIW